MPAISLLIAPCAAVLIPRTEARVIQPHHTAGRDHELLHRHGLPDAPARSDAEGAEGGVRQALVCASASAAACAAAWGCQQPPLRPVAERVRVVLLVVVDGIVAHAEVDALGKDVARDLDAAGQEPAAGGGPARPGGHAHRLVDAGAEPAAGGQGRAPDDLVGAAEAGVDFGSEPLVRVWVVEEVEEGG